VPRKMSRRAGSGRLRRCPGSSRNSWRWKERRQVDAEQDNPDCPEKEVRHRIADQHEGADQVVVDLVTAESCSNREARPGRAPLQWKSRQGAASGEIASEQGPHRRIQLVGEAEIALEGMPSPDPVLDRERLEQPLLNLQVVHLIRLRADPSWARTSPPGRKCRSTKTITETMKTTTTP